MQLTWSENTTLLKGIPLEKKLLDSHKNLLFTMLMSFYMLLAKIFLL